jgi:hypothetical protein
VTAYGKVGGSTGNIFFRNGQVHWNSRLPSPARSVTLPSFFELFGRRRRCFAKWPIVLGRPVRARRWSHIAGRTPLPPSAPPKNKNRPKTAKSKGTVTYPPQLGRLPSPASSNFARGDGGDASRVSPCSVDPCEHAGGLTLPVGHPCRRRRRRGKYFSQNDQAQRYGRLPSPGRSPTLPSSS